MTRSGITPRPDEHGTEELVVYAPPSRVPAWLRDLRAAAAQPVRRSGVEVGGWFRQSWLARRWERDVRHVPGTALGMAVATLALGGMLGDLVAGAEVLPGWNWIPSASRALLRWPLITISVLCAWNLFLRRRELMSVGALSDQEARPRRVVILPLSPSLHVGIGDAEVLFPGGGRIPLTGDLAADAEAIAGSGVRWPWRQMLRSVQPHREMLQVVWLVGSADACDSRGNVVEGTHRKLGDAKKLLQRYLAGVEVREWEAAVDFEDVRAIMRVLREILDRTGEEELRHAPGRRLPLRRFLREEDVVIDITGGFKPTSVAGAMMTLSSDITFQYVHTHSDQVREYDLMHTGPGGV